MTTDISKSALIGYGLLALPVAFAGFPLYVLAPDYFATHHGVSLSLLGVLLLVLRLFDAIQDPLIGALSDRYRKMTPRLMAVAAITLCLSICGLFNAVWFSPAIWFVLCMGVAVSSYSVLSINLSAYGALWGCDPKQQTRIAAYREGWGLLGLIVAVSLPGMLGQWFGKEQVYILYPLLLAVIMGLGLAIFYRWLRSVSLAAHSLHVGFSISSMLRSLPTPTRKLFIAYFVSMLASSIPAVLILFFVRDLLGAESYTGVFLLLYFLSGAVAMPLWIYVSRRVGKTNAWLFSGLVAVCSFAGAFHLGDGDIMGYGLICLFSGLALGADVALPPAIIADQLHAHNQSEYTASYYAILALIAKAALAAASAATLPALDAFGFVPAAGNDASGLKALSVAYALVPCLLKLASVGMVFFFFNPVLGAPHENLSTRSDIRNVPYV